METGTEEVRGGGDSRKGPERKAPPRIPDPKETIRPVPELVFLLDGEGRVVRSTGPHPGPRLAEFEFPKGLTVHDAVHPTCDGSGCRLQESWDAAWDAHRSGLAVEWLYASRVLDGVLKLRLQTVDYACRGLFGNGVSEYGNHSILFANDITSGYRAAEQDANPRWQAYRESGDSRLAAERFVPVGSPVVEAAPSGQLLGLASQLLLAQETEQKRLAAELHDGLGQSLSLLRFEIEGGIEQHDEPERLARTLLRAYRYVRRSQAELRSITGNLGPVLLKQRGLFGALNVLCEDLRHARPGLDVDVDLTGAEQDLPQPLSVCIYRIVQEALHNAARHAEPRSVEVALHIAADGVRLKVADDGLGMPLNGARREGLGLTTMRERVHSLGGEFRLVSAPREGCAILIYWAASRIGSAG